MASTREFLLAWIEGTGPFGGHFWINEETGEKRYTMKKPTGVKRSQFGSGGRYSSGFRRGGKVSAGDVVKADPTEGMGGEELAQWYAELWNALEEAGQDVDPAEIHTVFHELIESGWTLHKGGKDGKWEPIHEEKHEEAYGQEDVNGDEDEDGGGAVPKDQAREMGWQLADDQVNAPDVKPQTQGQPTQPTQQAPAPQQQQQPIQPAAGTVAPSALGQRWVRFGETNNKARFLDTATGKMRYNKTGVTPGTSPKKMVTEAKNALLGVLRANPQEVETQNDHAIWQQMAKQAVSHLKEEHGVDHTHDKDDPHWRARAEKAVARLAKHRKTLDIPEDFRGKNKHLVDNELNRAYHKHLSDKEGTPEQVRKRFEKQIAAGRQAGKETSMRAGNLADVKPRSTGELRQHIEKVPGFQPVKGDAEELSAKRFWGSMKQHHAKAGGRDNTLHRLHQLTDQITKSLERMGKGTSRVKSDLTKKLSQIHYATRQRDRDEESGHLEERISRVPTEKAGKVSTPKKSGEPLKDLHALLKSYGMSDEDAQRHVQEIGKHPAFSSKPESTEQPSTPPESPTIAPDASEEEKAPEATETPPTPPAQAQEPESASTQDATRAKFDELASAGIPAPSRVEARREHLNSIREAIQSAYDHAAKGEMDQKDVFDLVGKVLPDPGMGKSAKEKVDWLEKELKKEPPKSEVGEGKSDDLNDRLELYLRGEDPDAPGEGGGENWGSINELIGEARKRVASGNLSSDDYDRIISRIAEHSELPGKTSEEREKNVVDWVEDITGPIEGSNKEETSPVPEVEEEPEQPPTEQHAAVSKVAEEASDQEGKKAVQRAIDNSSGMGIKDLVAALSTALDEADKVGESSRKVVEDALVAAGAEALHESGDELEMKGESMEGPAGLFPGDPVRVVRPGFVHDGLLVTKSQVVPADGEQIEEGGGKVSGEEHPEVASLRGDFSKLLEKYGSIPSKKDARRREQFYGEVLSLVEHAQGHLEAKNASEEDINRMLDDVVPGAAGGKLHERVFWIESQAKREAKPVKKEAGKVSTTPEEPEPGETATEGEDRDEAEDEPDEETKAILERAKALEPVDKIDTAREDEKYNAWLKERGIKSEDEHASDTENLEGEEWDRAEDARDAEVGRAVDEYMGAATDFDGANRLKNSLPAGLRGKAHKWMTKKFEKELNEQWKKSKGRDTGEEDADEPEKDVPEHSEPVSQRLHEKLYDEDWERNLNYVIGISREQRKSLPGYMEDEEILGTMKEKFSDQIKLMTTMMKAAVADGGQMRLGEATDYILKGMEVLHESLYHNDNGIADRFFRIANNYTERSSFYENIDEKLSKLESENSIERENAASRVLTAISYGIEKARHEYDKDQVTPIFAAVNSKQEQVLRKMSSAKGEGEKGFVITQKIRGRWTPPQDGLLVRFIGESGDPIMTGFVKDPVFKGDHYEAKIVVNPSADVPPGMMDAYKAGFKSARTPIRLRTPSGWRYMTEHEISGLTEHQMRMYRLGVIDGRDIAAKEGKSLIPPPRQDRVAEKDAPGNLSTPVEIDKEVGKVLIDDRKYVDLSRDPFAHMADYVKGEHDPVSVAGRLGEFKKLHRQLSAELKGGFPQHHERQNRMLLREKEAHRIADQKYAIAKRKSKTKEEAGKAKERVAAELKEMLDDLDRDLVKMSKEVLSGLTIRPVGQLKVKVNTPEEARVVGEVNETIGKLMSGSVSTSLEINDDRKYTSYDTNNNVILSTKRHLSPKTIAHEIGHAIETQNPHILAASLQFLWSRVKGHDLKDMAKMGFRGVGIEDDFGKLAPVSQGSEPVYVGRIYESDGKWFATEILSKGLEFLVTNPVAFAALDPEYFAHVITCLRSIK